MVCTGNFVFKTIALRKSGTFTDENGKVIEYPSCYVLKVDELTNTGDINERKFKIDTNKEKLIEKLKELKAYDNVYLKFELTFYSSNVTVEIIDCSFDEF